MTGGTVGTGGFSFRRAEHDQLEFEREVRRLVREGPDGNEDEATTGPLGPFRFRNTQEDPRVLAREVRELLRLMDEADGL